MNKMQLVIVLALLAASTVAGTARAGDEGDCSNQDVIGLDPENPASGSITFCVVRSGLKARVRLGNLVPGDAYTVWWTYFDDPGSCETPYECGVPDFFGEDPQAVLGRMDSGVARPTGQAHFAGRVPGMVPSPGSQMWLFAFGHGPAADNDGKRLARQLLTPEDPGLGTPHLGNLVDGPLGFPVALNIFVIE